jgi:DNA-directed RNA polymerase specialized sigma subunit
MKIEVEENADISELINAVFSLNTVLKAKWTDRQREIINIYLKCDRTQSDVAKDLGINQSNVQKALSNSNFYTYQKVLDTITKTLSNIKEKQDV